MKDVIKSIIGFVLIVLIKGTILWRLWLMVVPAILPGFVAKGTLMAQIHWIDGVWVFLLVALFKNVVRFKLRGEPWLEI